MAADVEGNVWRPRVKGAQAGQAVSPAVELSGILKSVKSSGTNKILSDNRKARHDYHLLERYEGGLALTGTEVKAARHPRRATLSSMCLAGDLKCTARS